MLMAVRKGDFLPYKCQGCKVEELVKKCDEGFKKGMETYID